MRKFKDWSITSKTSLVFGLIISVLIVNFIITNYFKSLEKNDAVLIDLAGRNRMLTQKIAYLSLEYLDKEINLENQELENTITLFEKSLLVMKEGGIAPEMKITKELNPAKKEVLPLLLKIEETWAKYKTNAEIISNTPVEIIRTEDEIIGYDTLGNAITQPKQVVEKNQTVIEAYNSIKEGTPTILKLCNNLISKYKQLNETKKQNLNYILIILLIINLGIIVLGIYIIQIHIRNPIKKIAEITNSISRGNLSRTLEHHSTDELGLVATSVNKLVEKLNKITQFINEVGKENFSVEFEIMGENDHLGKSLNEMRNNFQKAAEDEVKRKEEDKKRNWATQGLAKFGEILRQENDNINELSYNIISSLVKYLEANQGGIFILNDNDKNKVFYELTAAYAYDRRKYLEKKIEPGEGLVGTCAVEKEKIYMTKIPNSYMEITSGLGDSNPKSLLLMPLKINEDVFGVMELASFKEFEEFEIEFIEKVGESIASSISSAKINMRTARLLKESQEQGEKLAQQEEEMRQNMEEMQATQEEMARKEAEMTGVFDAINNATGTFELDLNGRYMEANSLYLSFIGEVAHNLIGKDHKDYVRKNFTDLYEYDEMLDQLRNGAAIRKEFKYDIHGNEFWLDESFTPVRDSEDNIHKILVLSNNITEKKEQEQANIKTMEQLQESEKELQQTMGEMQEQQELIQKSEARARMIFENAMDSIITIDPQGLIDQFNPASAKLFGYSPDEVKGKNVSMLMPEKYAAHHDDYLKRYNSTLEPHIIGKAREAEGMNKNGSVFPIEINIQEAFIGEQKMFVGIIRDITQQKQLLEDAQQKNEELRAQEEELRQNLEEITATQEALEEKDEQQQKEIAKLNEENQQKLDKLKENEEERNKLMEQALAKEFEFKTKIEQLEKQLSEAKISDTAIKEEISKLIEWTDKDFSVKVSEIDEQHKKLVELINQLFAAFKEGKAKKQIKDILKALVDYTIYHFGTEEKYFKEFDFENTDKHVEEHKKFAGQVAQFQEDFIAGKVSVTYDLMNFLKDWLINHIQKTDRNYTDCFNKNGLK